MSDTILDSAPQYKQCYACGETFPATREFFYVHSQMKDGWNPRCRVCHKSRREPYHIEKLPEGQRRCTKCKQIFPETPEFFTRHKKAKGGLSECCKECKNSARRKPPIEKEPIPEGMKQCVACTKISPATTEFFTKHPQKKDGLNPTCKECRSKRRKGSPSERRYQLWYEKEHRKEISARARNYQHANKEKINRQTRERGQTEQGKILRRASRIRRKARKKAALGTLTAEQIQQKLKSQKFKCYYAACGYAKFERVNGQYVYHIEHTIPLSRTEHNPRHDINFVVLSCPECNMRKGSKLPHEFFEGGRLF